MALCTIGFILFLIGTRLFKACKIVPKMTKVRHGIQNSKLFTKQNEQAEAVELENMLNINPEAV